MPHDDIHISGDSWKYEVVPGKCLDLLSLEDDISCGTEAQGRHWDLKLEPSWSSGFASYN